MPKLYYCYEKEYPFFIRIIENGQSVRLPLDQYCREFTLDPNNIMLSREDFQKRLAHKSVEEKKPAAENLELW